jgi:hypothetical protein
MDKLVYLHTQMTPKTTTATALIVATFALVGLMTAGVSQTVFAQSVTDPLNGAFLDEFLGEDEQSGGTTDGTTTGSTTGGSITDESESTDETQSQATSQDETNEQSNSIDQDQTAAINEEIGTGSGSEVASAASSDSASDSFSDVSNTGTLGQNQELNNPTQVNTNNAGDDESRGAVVGFDLGFEQFTEQGSSIPGSGTSVPIIIP